MLGKSPKDLEMSPTFLDAEALIGVIAGEAGGAKTKIRRIEKALGCSARRARAFWNKEVRRIDAHEMKALEAAARQQKDAEMEIDTRNALQELRGELARLKDRLAELEGEDCGARA